MERLQRIAADAGISLVEVFGTDPHIRRDFLKTSGSKRQLKIRAEITTWSADLVICYRPDVITMESLVHLLSLTGMWRGIGSVHHKRGGVRGGFEVHGLVETITATPELLARRKKAQKRAKRAV